MSLINRAVNSLCLHVYKCESAYVLLLSSTEESRQLKVLGSPSSAGRDSLVCCVDLAGPTGRGSLASPLLSPVGFDCFDVTHQVLSKADTKNLKRKPHKASGQAMFTDNYTRKLLLKKKEQTAVLQGFA